MSIFGWLFADLLVIPIRYFFPNIPERQMESIGMCLYTVIPVILTVACCWVLNSMLNSLFS